MTGPLRRLRRYVLGLSTEEISELSQSMGGPPYPIPHISTQAPSSIIDTTPIPPSHLDPTDEAACTCGHPGAPQAYHLAPCPLTAPTPGDDVSDDAPTATHDQDTDTALPAPDPLTDTASPYPDASTITNRSLTLPCGPCGGTGTVTRTVNEILRETVSWIPLDDGDQVIREFYRRLLPAAPHLGPLFPADLLTAATREDASPGALQRDRLLQALLSVSELYGGNVDDMARLDTMIGSWGNAHAPFARPDGTVTGATPEEYDAVIEVFIGLLRAAFTDRFTAVHEQVWREALGYVRVGMLWTQWHSGMRSARYPRRTAGRD